MQIRVSIFLFLVTSSCVWGQDARQPIPVAYELENTWIDLPSVTASTTEPGSTTYNTYPFLRARDLNSGEILGAADPEFTCDPSDLRRTFRLEKSDFLLGEPILVEYRIELEGPGAWAEGSGGNYRSRGRDDNFYFLLQHEDGTWMNEIQPFMGGIGGGMGSGNRASSDAPYSAWQAVQRWTSPTRPGRYTLHCFYRPGLSYSRRPLVDAANALLPPDILKTHRIDPYGRLVNASTDDASTEYYLKDKSVPRTPEMKSPLLLKMPQPIHNLLNTPLPPPGSTADRDEAIALAVLGERQGTIRNAQVYASFAIQIRAGTPDERTAMVSAWEIQASPNAGTSHGYSRERAVLEAIHFAQTDDFLTTIVTWANGAPDYLQGNALSYGLYAMDSPKATALLLRHHNNLAYQLSDKIHWGSPLTEAQRRKVLSNLVALLEDPDLPIAMQALDLLRTFAGGWFFGSDTTPQKELTPQDRALAYDLWRQWLDAQPINLASYTEGAWGYIDQSGAFVISPRFTKAAPFSQGIASVSLGNQGIHIDPNGEETTQTHDDTADALTPVVRDDKWAYARPDGSEAIPPQYDRAGRFIAGRALVTLHAETMVIDQDGNVLFGPDRAIQSLNDDGTMMFTADSPTSRRYGLLAPDGSVILPAQFENILQPSEGLILVGVQVKSGALRYGFLDMNGETVIEPRFEQALPFGNGLAPVRDERFPNLWGYIDRTGNWVIAPQFDTAASFADGLAVASIRMDQPAKAGFGFIDPTGAWFIPPKFDGATPFSEGMAAVRVSSPFRKLLSRIPESTARRGQESRQAPIRRDQID